MLRQIAVFRLIVHFDSAGSEIFGKILRYNGEAKLSILHGIEYVIGEGALKMAASHTNAHVGRDEL